LTQTLIVSVIGQGGMGLAFNRIALPDQATAFLWLPPVMQEAFHL
jgi:hypothetical protein